MKSLILCLCFAFAAAAQGADTNLYKMFVQNRRRGMADHFWIAENRLVAVSRWNPDKVEQPPVSISQAISIARKYLMKKEEVTGLKVESVTLVRMATEGPFEEVAYYRVRFNLGEFDHPVAVVLMDSSTVEPRDGPRTDDPPR